MTLKGTKTTRLTCPICMCSEAVQSSKEPDGKTYLYCACGCDKDKAADRMGIAHLISKRKHERSPMLDPGR